jgi:hypothetical protein
LISEVDTFKLDPDDSAEIIPPVRPGLFDTSLLGDDSLVDHGSENAESHSHPVIIVAMDAGAFLETLERRTKDDDTVVKLICLYTELAYFTSARI